MAVSLDLGPNLPPQIRPISQRTTDDKPMFVEFLFSCAALRFSFGIWSRGVFLLRRIGYLCAPDCAGANFDWLSKTYRKWLDWDKITQNESLRWICSNLNIIKISYGINLANIKIITEFIRYKLYHNLQFEYFNNIVYQKTSLIDGVLKL